MLNSLSDAKNARTRQSTSIFPCHTGQKDVVYTRKTNLVLRTEALSAFSAVEEIALCIEEYEQRWRRIACIGS